MILQIFILAILLFVAFYTARFLFWFLFIKDAPELDEQENNLIHYQDSKLKDPNRPAAASSTHRNQLIPSA